MQSSTIASSKIVEVARDLEISPSRLRNWCEQGMVDFEINKNTRYILGSEIPKVKRIAEIIDSSPKRVSLVTVKEMLIEEGYDFGLAYHEESREQTSRKQSVTNKQGSVIVVNSEETEAASKKAAETATEKTSASLTYKQLRKKSSKKKNNMAKASKMKQKHGRKGRK